MLMKLKDPQKPNNYTVACFMQVVKRFWILVTFLMGDTNISVFKQPEANMLYCYLRQMLS